MIDAVLSGDAEAQRAVTTFEPVACTATPVGIGAFYCLEGEADGTVSNVIAVAQCEGYFFREDGFALPSATLTLHAVTGSEARYGIVFSRLVGPSQLEWGLRLSVEDGRITSIHYGCGETPSDMATGDVVLAPP